MPLTKVTNSMIEGSTINPDDLGADPTGTNDSSSAIQAAIDTGKTVLFSNGANYKITSGITLNNSQQLIDGNNATLTPVGTFNAVTLTASETIFRNLNIDATDLVGDVINLPTAIGGGTFWIEHINCTGGTRGLVMVNQYSAYITSCRFTYFTDYGVYLTSSTGGSINSLWFTSCYFVNGGKSGLPVVYLAASGGVYFDKCTWQGNAANTIGIHVESVNGLYLTNNYIEEYNTSRWLWLSNATTANVIQFISVQNNYFLMDGVPVVFGLNSKTNAQIISNTFQSSLSSSGAAVQGMVSGFIPEVHSNLGSRGDIDDSFTPTLQFGGNEVGITYTTRLGKIRNYGNYLQGGVIIKLSSKGSSGGDATVSIPTSMLFAVPNQNVDSQVTFETYANLATITSLVGTFDNSTVRMYNAGATSTSPLSNANFTNTSEIQLSFRSSFVTISQ